MLGLVILAIATGYLALAIGVTVVVVRAAKAKGASRATQVAAGWMVGMIFFLIPFWDLIPTVFAHHYYCAKEATFEVYKTVDQWKKENTQILTTLRAETGTRFVQVGEYERFPLNQRLVSDRKGPTERFLSVRRDEGRIMDTKNSEVLARFVDFRAGYAPLAVGGEGAWKFWLRREGCDEGEHTYSNSYSRFKREIQSIGVGK